MNDLIYRNKAIEAISKLPVKVDNLGYTWMIAGDVLKRIYAIPPVEPERKIIYCKDCKHWKDRDGVYRRGFDAESKCPLNLKEVYEGTFYCGMAERRDNFCSSAEKRGE